MLDSNDARACLLSARGGLGPAICEEISLRHTLLPMEPEGREIEADDKGLSSRISQLRPIVQSIL